MKINKFAFLEIGRKKGAFTKLNVGLEEPILKKLLIEALPLGNPENEVMKVISIKEEMFLSLLKLSDQEDYGLALVISLDDELLKLNPFGFVEGLKKILTENIKSYGENLSKNLEIDYKEPEFFIDKYENFDTFIFSLLTQQKTLVIGEKDDLWKFLAGLYEFVPAQLKKYVTLAANTTNFTNRVYLHALPITNEVLKILDEKKGAYTVLFLPTKIAYGKFSSPFCMKINSLFLEHKEDKLKQELLQFFAKAVETNVLPPVADFAAANQLSLADASLLIWMRANHFELEVPKGILKFTN